MKIAILANDQPGFIQPMAAGLKKMLDSLGVRAKIFSDGLAMLNYSPRKNLETGLKNIIKLSVNLAKPQNYLYQKHVSYAELRQFEAQMKTFDLIVVVCNIPDAFLLKKLSRIEKIRMQSNAPIVLYQNYYLATRGPWSQKILDPALYGGGFGLERYDWYLSASMVSEYPLSQEAHPCTLIGHDLRDSSLSIPSDKPFKALLDFKRKGFEHFRELQIQALEETETKYTQLSGRYRLHEIRQLYRQHSALFLSFRESFGLPVVENQLCGNYIFTPHKQWLPSHYTNKSVHEAGEGDLGSNFIVYDNELAKLKKLIRQCKDKYCPEDIVSDFKASYPALYHGDLSELKEFIAKVSAGEITAELHRQHLLLNERIVNSRAE